MRKTLLATLALVSALTAGCYSPPQQVTRFSDFDWTKSHSMSAGDSLGRATYGKRPEDKEENQRLYDQKMREMEDLLINKPEINRIARKNRFGV